LSYFSDFFSFFFSFFFSSSSLLLFTNGQATKLGQTLGSGVERGLKPVWHLIIQVILLDVSKTFAYLCIGSVCLIKLEEEVQALTFFDGLYCCMITLSSVGFGDISPQTQQGRLFSVFYIPVGILVLTSTISSLGYRCVHFFDRRISREERTQKQIPLLVKVSRSRY
jgi:uncharacterized protein YggT (Ycf19 family)